MAGGRRLPRRLKGAGIFATGSVLAGGATYAVVGLAGRALGGVVVPVAVAMLLWALLWHLRGARTVRFGRNGVQSDRQLASQGGLGLLYFGALLGAGLLTQMSTPLVWGGAALSLVLGPAGGFAYGVGFGLGRSVPALVGALAAHRFDPGMVALSFIENQRRARWVGAMVAAGSIALSLTQAR